MMTSHLYSPDFYNILHKSSLHLGKWQKLETRNTLVPCNAWSESLLYGPGIVVKYAKEYFKAEGATVSAEPGNQSHLRYYVSEMKNKLFWLQPLTIIFYFTDRFLQSSWWFWNASWLTYYSGHSANDIAYQIFRMVQTNLNVITHPHEFINCISAR